MKIANKKQQNKMKTKFRQTRFCAEAPPIKTNDTLLIAVVVVVVIVDVDIVGNVKSTCCRLKKQNRKNKVH